MEDSLPFRPPGDRVREVAEAYLQLTADAHETIEVKEVYDIWAGPGLLLGTVRFLRRRSITVDHVDLRLRLRYCWFTYPDWRRRMVLSGLETGQAWAVRAAEDMEVLL